MKIQVRGQTLRKGPDSTLLDRNWNVALHYARMQNSTSQRPLLRICENSKSDKELKRRAECNTSVCVFNKQKKINIFYYVAITSQGIHWTK